MSRFRRPRRRDKLRPLGELVGKIYPSPDHLQETRVFGWWSRALPPRVVQNARPVNLRHGILWVHVRSPVWAQELQLMSDELLARVRAAEPSARVAAMRFRVGPLPPRIVIPKKKKPRPIRPDVSQIPESLGRELARIGDDDLRGAIARAASVTLQRVEGDDT